MQGAIAELVTTEGSRKAADAANAAKSKTEVVKDTKDSQSSGDPKNSGGNNQKDAKPGEVTANSGDKGVAKTAGKKADDVIHVTKDGVALPPGAKHKIPDNYVQNPHRNGNYGEIVDGKYKERLRIDPATPPDQKGPNDSYYHKDGKGKHCSPKDGDPDPGCCR